MEESNNTMTIQLNKITCPVCHDRFKEPKMLQCGHSFCQPCADKFFESTLVTCPICRDKVQVMASPNSADQLPTNYVLKALVDSDTSLFDKDSLCRSFGECPVHEDVCDQFCKTCEKQVCKQCISDHHQGTSHDTSSVGVAVVQEKEVLASLAVELGDLVKRLKVIGSNITESEKTCYSEADQLSEEINASIAECTDNIAAHGESLQVVVQEDKEKIMKYLDDLKLKHSEIFLWASYTLNLCQSLQIDLDKSNLSRVAVMKLLMETKRKIQKDLEKLEGKKNVLHMGLRFQSFTTSVKSGKLTSTKSSIPTATHMKTIRIKNDEEWLKGMKKNEKGKKPDFSSQKSSFSFMPEEVPKTDSTPPNFFSMGLGSQWLPNPVKPGNSSGFGEVLKTTPSSSTKSSLQVPAETATYDALLAFLWPIPTWMLVVKLHKAGSHNFVKFSNLHSLTKKNNNHEIGVDQKWAFLSHSDYEGKFVLCLSEGKIHKFSLPSQENLEEPGKIVDTIFISKGILGIAWDKVQLGCYVLLNDKKTLLHAEFGETRGFKEVAVFEEEIMSGGATHFFHVNEEGSMAICDHGKKVVHFFENIEAEPTATVKAPPDLQNPTPECVNTRRGQKLWYVMWKSRSIAGYEVKLYVYDFSFQLIGPIPNLCVNARSNESRAMFCFQSEYVAVTIDDKVEVYVLS